ncbi:MAG: glycosyl transferase family 2, partial [Prevotella sp.]|nr:glycosyl transferase family 2 [Prevotella sp.]
MNPFFRRIRKTQVSASGEQPPVTILLVSNGDHVALDEHLPIFLTQEYSPGYEVVVVTEKADVETENVLKRYSQNERLYHTFVPESSRYMSKSKLAITLGVKAAKNEWIILTDPRCKPAVSHWIEAMSRQMGSNNSLVLGYANYSEEAKPYHRFERLHTALYLLREAQQGRPYRTNSMNVAFRKSEYMDQQGFLEYLKYSIGEYDFLVNKFGRQGTAAIATDSDTLLTENAVSSKTWQNRQVYYHEVGKHLDGGAWLRVLRALDRWSMALNYLLILGTGIFAGFTHRWILLGVTVAALILTIVLRSLIGKKALQEFQVNISAWKVVPLEINMQWHRFLTRMRYEYADKNDFISHKV